MVHGPDGPCDAGLFPVRETGTHCDDDSDILG